MAPVDVAKMRAITPRAIFPIYYGPGREPWHPSGRWAKPRSPSERGAVFDMRTAVTKRSKHRVSPEREKSVQNDFFSELVSFRDLITTVAKLGPSKLRNGLAELETQPGEMTRTVLQHMMEIELSFERIRRKLVR